MLVCTTRTPELARNHIPLNLDTGKVINLCKWANDETGEYCVYVTDEEGNIERQWANPEFRHLPIEDWWTPENDKYGGLIAKTEIKKGNIKIIHISEVDSKINYARD